MKNLQKSVFGLLWLCASCQPEARQASSPQVAPASPEPAKAAAKAMLDAGFMAQRTPVSMPKTPTTAQVAGASGQPVMQPPNAGPAGMVALAPVAGSAGHTGGAPASAGAGGLAAGAGAGNAAADKGPVAPITVWIAGDSTVMTYTADRAPLEGWGQELHMFLDPKADIDNQALGGRSTRTFVYNNVVCVNGQAAFSGGTPSKTGARWERIENGIKPGDACLIQFGHNDEAKEYCERYVPIPDFKDNLAAMIDAILERKGTPILVTPMSRLSYKNGEFTATLTDYSAAMKEVASAKGIELVDLNSMSVEFYRSAGYEKLSTEIFEQGGNTHFQKQGAIEMARLVSKGLAANGGTLARYVKPTP